MKLKLFITFAIIFCAGQAETLFAMKKKEKVYQCERENCPDCGKELSKNYCKGRHRLVCLAREEENGFKPLIIITGDTSQFEYGGLVLDTANDGYQNPKTKPMFYGSSKKPIFYDRYGPFFLLQSVNRNRKENFLPLKKRRFPR